MSRIAGEARAAGQKLCLVPTMGALHEGHLSLIGRGLDLADHVTTSIFVNPTQFGPSEDFERYPRTLDADLEKIEQMGGVDVVFVPGAKQMYPSEQLAWVNVDSLTQSLCGRFRPGHFRGVATVVTKIFGICRPHVAVFGRKDAQQFLMLRRMSKDLNLGVEVVGHPTVRERDGLAVSSRNRYLGDEERRQAVVLSRAVRKAGELVARGERNPEIVEQAMRDEIAQAPLGRIQYAEVVDTESLQPVADIYSHPEVLAAVAVYFGETRLIDNVFVRVGDSRRAPDSPV